jgi:hypothetical protein
MDIKMASYLYRTAQPFTLATFRSWGSSTGAGRIRLAAANIKQSSDADYFLIKYRSLSTEAELSLSSVSLEY